TLLPELEGLRAQQNEANARIREAQDAERREQEIEAMRGVATRAKQLEQELATVEQQLQEALARLPNTPDPSAAPGPEDELVREVGAVPELAFEPREHLQLAGEMIDVEHAAKTSGTRF